MTYRVVLGATDSALAAEAIALAGESAQLEVVATAGSAVEVLDVLTSIDADVVLLHEGLGPLPVLDLAREVSVRHPYIGVLLAVRDSRPEVLRAALQAGVRGVVAVPLSLDEMEATVASAATWTRAVRDRLSSDDSELGDGVGGTLFAIAGAKGGVGATTIAVQLALRAAEAGRSVCLVDFDLQSGDVPSLLDVTHHRGVADLLDVATEVTTRHLEESLYVHSSGLRVLVAPDEGERGEEVDGRAARGILGAIKSRFEVVVVDCGSVVTEANAVAVEVADAVLLVTTPDVPALRAANRVLGMWRRLDIRKVDSVVSVVNRVSRKVEVQPDLAGKVLAAPVASTSVPAGFVQLETAVNTGDPSQLGAGAVRKAITALGREVALLPAAPAVRRRATSLPRGRRAEAGQVAVETVGVGAIVLIVAVMLWQIALTGYSLVLAGHAARAAARQLAVGAGRSTIAATAEADLPSSWRSQMSVTPAGNRVRVTVAVPAIVPGIHSPIHVSASAGTVIEGRP